MIQQAPDSSMTTYYKPDGVTARCRWGLETTAEGQAAHAGWGSRHSLASRRT